jgi:hypothetical protein
VFSSWHAAGVLTNDLDALEAALVDEHDKWVRRGGKPDELSLRYLQDLYNALQQALDTRTP